MTKDEALKIALEALEDVQDMMTTSDWFNERVKAIRQALAQAEQSDFDRIAALEAEARRVFAESGGQIEALRQILNQSPAATKMIDKDLLEICKEIISNAEEYEFDDGLGMGISMDLYNRLESAVDADEPLNTDVAEPIGEIVEAHGLIAVSIPEMPPVGTKLYVKENK